MNYTPDQLRRAWLAAALDEWSNPRSNDPARNAVRDDDRGKEGDRDIITGYFADAGWSFHLARFGGEYREHASTSWCGIFQAAMGRRLGEYLEPDRCVPVALDADVAKFALPSTARLASSAKWRAAGVPSPVGFRMVQNGRQFARIENGHLVEPDPVLLPGAIATVKTSGNKPEAGDHIVLIESYNADTQTIRTVEGNGRGELGDGDRGEGVVRCTRKLADVRRVYHLDLAHFETMERAG